MPFNRPPLVLIALLLWLATGPARAETFRDLAYGDAAGGSQTLDIYSPVAPGPHPVVVFIHGGGWSDGDKTDAEPKSAVFTAQGYVFVSINYRLAPGSRHPAQVEDCAAAIAWVSQSIAVYGGDPARIHLMGEGAGAHLAALVATDARQLAAHGLGPELLRGVVLLDAVAYDLPYAHEADANEGRAAIEKIFGDSQTRLDASPVAQVSASRTPPPMLIFFPEDDHASRRQAERFADRVRGAGVSAQVQSVHGLGKQGLGLDFGAAGEVTTTQTFAWLRALQIPRAQRFENLVFEAEAEFPDAGAAVPVLQSYEGALYAGFAVADRGPTIVRKSTAGGSWNSDAEFDASYRTLLGLQVARFSTDLDGVPLARAPSVLLAALATVDGSVHFSQRTGAPLAWSQPRALTPPNAGESLVGGVEHRDAVTGISAFFLGVSDQTGAIHRFVFDPVRGIAHAPGGEAEVRMPGPLLGLAVANGTVFAAVGGSASGGDTGGLYRRIDGAAPRWTRALAWSDSGPLHALAAVVDPQGGGYEVVIGASEQGTIERIDPRQGYATTRELDFRAAFRELWRGLGEERVVATSSFTPLRHPDGNGLVHAIGLSLAHPDARAMPYNGAYYLVRQLDASYSYGLARDFATPASASNPLATLRTIVASPFADDAGRAFYFGGGDTASGSPWTLRAVLSRATLAEGMWWDRARPGHGLSLHPAGDQWIANFYTYDDAGEPTWYLAIGEIVAGRFVPDSNGLSHYRFRPGDPKPQVRDVTSSGAIEIEFAAGASRIGCQDGTDRRDATALAALHLELGGRTVDWCLEPVHYGPPGLPAVDSTGIWHGGSTDAGWGMMLAPQGYDGETREAGIVFFYDGRGEPRWALGAGDAVRGAAALDLRSFRGYCPGCEASAVTSQPAGSLTHQLRGFCGDIAGTASIALEYPGAAGGRLVFDNVALERLSTPRCY